MHQLHVFRTVAVLGSYTRAMEELHIAQPAVSAHVAALQTHLGVRLFARQGRGVRLTEAGTEFLSYTERLLALRSDFEQAASDIVAVRRGSVRIGASTTAGIYVVPRHLGAFHRAYPAVTVSLEVANRHTILQRLQAGDIDLGVMGLLDLDGKVLTEPFLPNELVVVARPDHPLVGRAAADGPISLVALAAQPLLVRERGSGTRKDTLQVFERAGIAVQISQEFGSSGAIKVGVLAGLGLAVLPREAIELHLATGELCILPVEGFPIQRDWYVVRLGSRPLSPSAAALRQELLDASKRD